MSGFLKFIIGLIALTVLWFVTDQIKHEPIESDLTAKSQAALAALEADWASVEVYGRNAVVSGTAPSLEAGEAAIAAVGELRGVHSARGDFTSLDVVSPFLWRAQQSDDMIKLTGVVPSRDAMESLVISARAKFPGKRVINEMRIAAGVPDGDWAGVATIGLSQLADLDFGMARLRDMSLYVEGGTQSPAIASDIKAALAKLGAGYSGSDKITVTLPEVEPAPPAPPEEPAPPPVIVPEEAQVEIDQCQTRIDEVMSGQTINFRTSSAEVFPQPNPIIQSLAAIARECPSTRIVISGHTDSIGEADLNQSLSEARAQAIVNLLVDEEVPEQRLEAQGFGASKPVADNSTPEGRSTNRRIEFRVLYAGAP